MHNGTEHEEMHVPHLCQRYPSPASWPWNLSWTEAELHPSHNKRQDTGRCNSTPGSAFTQPLLVLHWPSAREPFQLLELMLEPHTSSKNAFSLSSANTGNWPEQPATHQQSNIGQSWARQLDQGELIWGHKMSAHLSTLDCTVFALFLPHKGWREYSQQAEKSLPGNRSRRSKMAISGHYFNSKALQKLPFFLTGTITLLFILQAFCSTVSVKCDRKGSHLL